MYKVPVISYQILYSCTDCKHAGAYETVKITIIRSLSGYYVFRHYTLCIMKHRTSILLKPVKRDKIMPLRAAPGAER